MFRRLWSANSVIRVSLLWPQHMREPGSAQDISPCIAKPTGQGMIRESGVIGLRQNEHLGPPFSPALRHSKHR
jgi:hypothetical protein